MEVLLSAEKAETMAFFTRTKEGTMEVADRVIATESNSVSILESRFSDAEFKVLVKLLIIISIFGDGNSDAVQQMLYRIVRHLAPIYDPFALRLSYSFRVDLADNELSRLAFVPLTINNFQSLLAVSNRMTASAISACS